MPRGRGGVLAMPPLRALWGAWGAVRGVLKLPKIFAPRDDFSGWNRVV